MSCTAFKLRFGVIGTNFVSDWLLEGAAEDPRFEVAAIYSRSQDTANAFAESTIFRTRLFHWKRWPHRL